MRRPFLRSGWRSRLAHASILGGLLLAASCSQDATESSSPQNGSCAAPNQSCSGVCSNVSIDPANCGSCGTRCSAGQTCQAGQCVVSCTAPQINCGGLCADPGSNALHCGGCNLPCAAGQICQNYACVTGSCQAGQVTCNGACVSTATDSMNCGTCGRACLVGETCQAGVCTGGSSGTGGTGGTAGMSSGGSAGASTGGSAGMSTGGTAGASTSGTGGMSTGGTGGMPAGGAGGKGGAGGGVSQSSTCPNITWPTASGSRNLGKGMSVSGVFDGGMNTVEGTLEDCTTGNQDTTTPLIDVANGGTVRNVVFGRNIGDGIHCQGSCTIENVWFPYICDDAITIDGSGTATIRNSGFKNARDKTIQHNGTATVTIDNVYVETAGKLYRSCGDGCSSSARRSATLSNIVAIGVDEIAGVSTNDTVTLRNICMYRSFSVCSMYDPGTSDETENGVNQSNEGPSSNCVFTANDVHALLSRVQGIPFDTQTMCGGPNGYKSGSTGTSCVSGFDKCLKSCAPGGYGFKEITCSGGLYQEGTGTICATPTDATAAMNIAGSRVMSVTTPRVTNNGECSPEWATAVESSNTTNKCVCVHKPGYYSHDNWLAWDCQTRWW